MAHIGYYQNEFVARRGWLDDATYADLVALCQFLPGPTSSQIGFALGWKRAGWKGALAAWIGFTTPSVILMLTFAYGVKLAGNLEHAGWIQGLKIAAVAVVAQAVRTMAAKLCPDRPRALIAIGAAVVLLLFPWQWSQLMVLLLGSGVGAILYRKQPIGAVGSSFIHRRSNGLPWLAAFAALLVLLPWLAKVWPVDAVVMADGFFRAGSLVFGGGHVVLPFLEDATVGRGLMDHDTFLAGYGAAQALPGPLFSVAAYLGALIRPGGIGGGLLAVVALYLPSLFLVFGTLPRWDRFRAAPRARALLAGTNAAVVGLLGAALYSPIWTSAITGPERLALMLGAYGGLEFLKLPPWVVVLACAAVGGLAFR